MSTLTSSDFNLKRPTTRVHAPPGGGSNWSFNNNDIGGSTSNQRKQQTKDITMNSPIQSPSASSSISSSAPPPMSLNASSSLPPPPPIKAGTSRIAIIKTSCDAEIVDQITQNTWDQIQYSSPTLNAQTFTVPSVNELPYAANKLALYGGFQAVIVIGFLNGLDPLTPAMSSSICQALINISVTTVKPIIRGLFIGEPKVASVKAKGGYGKEFAMELYELIHLGGFQGPQITSQRNNGGSKTSTNPGTISRGNILPPKLLSASRSVLHTLDIVRASLYEHGARGIAGLGRKFRIIDDDGNKQLDLSEFTKAMKEHRLGLSDQEIQEIFQFMDEDKSGGINFDEFLLAVRGELNERRTQMVLAAFAILDADGNGVIELSDIQSKYSADKHPDVLAGRKTTNEVLREFLDTFDGGEKDGKVYPKEFIRYYANVSASIDEDDYFELMIRNAWHISGGEGWCENTTCRRVLVTQADGTQKIMEVKNDIGISASNMEAIRANLQSQGLQDGASIATKGAGMEIVNENKRPGDMKEPPFKSRYPTKKSGAGASSIVFG